MSDITLFTRVDKIKGFDLNLLLTFEVIFIHQSVSRAATHLRVSPSAVSQSLTKLRHFFSDPLFIRAGRGLVATGIAENLHIQLSQGFEHILRSLDKLGGAITENKFIIYSSTYPAIILLPEILARIKERNYMCGINYLSTVKNLDNGEDILIQRKADFVIDTRPYYSSSMQTEYCKDDPIVAVCRVGHPRLGRRLSREEMKQESATFVNGGEVDVMHTHHDVNDYLRSQAPSFSSSSVMVNLAITETTDLVSFIPEWAAKKFQQSFNLKILECYFPVDPVRLFITYNKSSLDNYRFIELLNIIKNNECSGEHS